MFGVIDILVFVGCVIFNLIFFDFVDVKIVIVGMVKIEFGYG